MKRNSNFTEVKIQANCTKSVFVQSDVKKFFFACSTRYVDLIRAQGAFSAVEKRFQTVKRRLAERFSRLKSVRL